MPKIESSLVAAYRAAHYWVEVDGKRIELRVGEAAPELDAVLVAKSVTSWALLTAHNPRSQPRTADENSEAQGALVRELASMGRTLLTACGSDPRGAWSEMSVVALDLDETEARRLMRAYKQNAYLVGRVGEPVTLRITKTAKELNEAERSQHVRESFATWFPKLTKLGEEVRIGKYRLDVLADEPARDGSATRDLVVIELKVNAHHGTLGQLLLYRNALLELAPKLPESTWKGRVRCVLVTTHLDKNLELIARELGIELELKVCVGDGDTVALVEHQEAPDTQVWNQTTDGKHELVWSGDRLAVVDKTGAKT